MHQNGELLSKTSRPFASSGIIFLTANPDGELCAPYYPLPSDIKLLKITKRGVELDLDPNWAGFTTCDGKIENVSSDRRAAYTHIMKRGDFGSIAYNDLRILIRIGHEHKPTRPEPKRTGEYRGGGLDLWWGREFLGLGAGLAASAVFFAAFIFGLKDRPDDRPKTFVELPEEYTLPFISPKHFAAAPESLQESYDRRHMVISATTFTDRFVNITLDLNAEPEEYTSPILQSAAATYAERFEKDLQKAREADENRNIAERKLLADSRNGLMVLPVVQGEPLSARLLRMQSTLNRWYESTEYTKKLREKTTAAFSQDAGYDFQNYKQLDKSGPKEIAPYQASHDEETMYKDAEEMAAKAERQSARIKKLRAHYDVLKAENSRPLTMAEAADYSPTMSQREFDDLNKKIDGIIASIFDPSKPKKYQEPIIGSVDVNLVKKVIDKSRFELQLCYELALRRNQDAAGLMEWRWHLDTQGRVSDLELVESNIADDKMISCIREKLTRWNWPKPQKGTIQISFPFYFKPTKG